MTLLLLPQRCSCLSPAAEGYQQGDQEQRQLGARLAGGASLAKEGLWKEGL
jgi:hypothetical protein